MARLKGWKGSGKSRTLKSATVTYVNRGALVASSWPKKRGRPKSPITREQNEWFRQANELAKYADGQAQWMAIELSRNSPWYPRDILISAMAGRLFETLNLDGVEFRSMAVNEDVSSDLDFLAGNVPGTIIVRGQDMWGALLPGSPGDALVAQGPGDLPAYAPIGDDSALSYAANLPGTTFSGSPHATKGIQFSPNSDFTIHSVGCRLEALNGSTYRGVIVKIGAAWVIDAILAETADVPVTVTEVRSLHEPLITPVKLLKDFVYAICWTRREGIGTSPLPMNIALNIIPMIGLPIKYYTPSGSLTVLVVVASADPAPGEVFIPASTAQYFLSARISV